MNLLEFILSSIAKLLGFLQIFALVNKNPMQFLIQSLTVHMKSFLLSLNLGIELLGH